LFDIVSSISLNLLGSRSIRWQAACDLRYRPPQMNTTKRKPGLSGAERCMIDIQSFIWVQGSDEYKE